MALATIAAAGCGGGGRETRFPILLPSMAQVRTTRRIVGKFELNDANALRWLDPPPDAAFAHARELLATLGLLDADGYLHITGREKDLIIRGGINISPLEIDSILLQRPEIIEVATVGVPDHTTARKSSALWWRGRALPSTSTICCVPAARSYPPPRRPSRSCSAITCRRPRAASLTAGPWPSNGA